jgi:hypothetical protein
VLTSVTRTDCRLGGGQGTQNRHNLAESVGFERGLLVPQEQKVPAVQRGRFRNESIRVLVADDSPLLPRPSVEDDAHADPLSVMACVDESLRVVELHGGLVE